MTSYGMSMVMKDCEYGTNRLPVKAWCSFSSRDWRDQYLAQVVSWMLTENVTRSLPPDWQGKYTIERGRKCIKGREEEGKSLLVVDRSTLRAIGLMILFVIKTEGGDGETELRLGYLLSEATLGQGIASELLTGFVTWCGKSLQFRQSLGVLHPTIWHLLDCWKRTGSNSHSMAPRSLWASNCIN